MRTFKNDLMQGLAIREAEGREGGTAGGNLLHVGDTRRPYT